MSGIDLAGAILGLLGRVGEGVSQAIAAARANNEEAAFDILELAIADTAQGIQGMRAQLKANREAATKALDEKFPGGAP